MRRQDWIELVALSLLWGLTFFSVAIALREVPLFTLVWLRCILAAVILIPIVLMLGHAMPRTVAQWRDFAVMALLNNVFPFSLIFFGQKFIASGLTSVLNAATPLMSLLVARVLAGEKLVANKFGGVVLGMAGVGILIGPDVANFDSRADLGMLAVLGGAFCYGLSGLWGRRFKSTPPLVSAASQVTASSIILLPVAAVQDQFWTLPWPSTQVTLAVLSLASLSTAFAYILFYRIMARAGSNNVMLVTLLIPISAIALGVVILGESFNTRQIAGAVVIGLSLLLIDGRLFGIEPKPAAAGASK